MRRFEAAAEKRWDPPLMNLYSLVNQMVPERSSAFRAQTFGLGFDKGAVESTRAMAREEAASGPNMDINRLNDKLYNDVRLATQIAIGGRPGAWGRGTDHQKAAIDAQLESIRDGIKPSDIFPPENR